MTYKKIWGDLVGTKVPDSKYFNLQSEMKVTKKGYEQHLKTGIVDGSEFKGHTGNLRKKK